MKLLSIKTKIDLLIEKAKYNAAQPLADKILGFRPKAHSHFIKKFKEYELEVLANDVVQYIHLNGIQDAK